MSEKHSHSDPRCPVGNFIADASGYVVEAPFEGSMAVVESCTFGSNGVGTCVAVLPAPFATTSTYSGSIVPFYTLVTTPHNSASRPSAASLGNLRLWGYFSVVIAALFHVL